jgi:hypothetical protein
MALIYLDNGMMISPGLFEAVCQKFNWGRTFRSQDQKASCRGAKAADQPKNILHSTPPSFSAHRVGCGEAYFVCLLQLFRMRGEDRAAKWGNSYTLRMDSVRFGRALGIGARAAARTLVTAVDAATAPNPSASASTTAAPAKDTSTQAKASGVRLGQQAARTTAQVKHTSKGLKEGSKRFGEAIWGPFVKLSGVLWLELTGVFFGIFAVFAIVGAWKMATNHDAPRHLIGAGVMAVLFGYFCVSSFVKASRRGRGR